MGTLREVLTLVPGLRSTWPYYLIVNFETGFVVGAPIEFV